MKKKKKINHDGLKKFNIVGAIKKIFNIKCKIWIMRCVNKRVNPFIYRYKLIFKVYELKYMKVWNMNKLFHIQFLWLKIY